jgi:hypothetical protein
VYLSSARYILRRGRVLLLLEGPLKWERWERRRGYTSAVEGPYSHHHLDVPSTCWRHLCVCLMPAAHQQLSRGYAPSFSQLFVSKQCFVSKSRLDGFAGAKSCSRVIESSSEYRSNHTVHARCRELSVQGNRNAGCTVRYS